MSSCPRTVPVEDKNILAFDGGKSHICFGSLQPKSGATLLEQLTDVHQQLDSLLAVYGCERTDIVKENVFLRGTDAKAPCQRLLRDYYSGVMPVTNFIFQPPVGGAQVGLEVLAFKGHKVRVERISPHLTIVRDGGYRWAYVGGVEPMEEEKDTYTQALSCFAQLHEHLAKAGFHFNQVVRTWIYERDIVTCEKGAFGLQKQRYQILNDARGKFFATGNGGNPFAFPYDLPPASTGIGMSQGTFVMECLALDVPKGSIEITPLKNPQQIDAHAYSHEILERGAAAIKSAPLFSRGMSIRMGYKMLLISGTASIKGQETVCLDDPEGQTRTTLENINLVLGQAQASLKDVQQVRVYIKDSTSKAELENRVRVVKKVVEETVPRVPTLFLIADVCRDNLLVEIEALSFVKTPAKKPARSSRIVRPSQPRPRKRTK